MIEYCKITGNTESNLIEVKFKLGITAFCKLSTINGEIMNPDWVVSNKSKMMAIVSFEDNDYSNPTILGFLPHSTSKTEVLDTNLYAIIGVLSNFVDEVSGVVNDLISADITTPAGTGSMGPNITKTLTSDKEKLDKFKDELEKLKDRFL